MWRLKAQNFQIFCNSFFFLQNFENMNVSDFWRSFRIMTFFWEILANRSKNGKIYHLCQGHNISAMCELKSEKIYFFETEHQNPLYIQFWIIRTKKIWLKTWLNLRDIRYAKTFFLDLNKSIFWQLLTYVGLA